MDRFIFKPSLDAVMPGDNSTIHDLTAEELVAVAAGHDPMDLRAVWGSDGASLQGMHIDPVIPGKGGFEDPSFGFEDPLFG